ncbi:MAG TPA: hypothetical protein PLK31_02180 [Chloroflexota bacterium]|nr:hypothetical protein [Chloroflexota bacterium]
MSADSNIAKFINQLEDAGELGYTAFALLTPFLASGPNAGAFRGTDTGFVWSKTMGGGFADSAFPFLGLGQIKVTGALLSATLGVQLENGAPAHINVLFSFMGEDGNSQTVLEIYPKIAALADKIVDPQDANRVVGYRNVGDRLQIPLPMAALEFNFRIKEDGIHSAMIFHESLSDLTTAQRGILQMDLDRVIVFPKLGKVGLYVDQLFVDFSSNAATDFIGMFPEVYDPSWKGFGAKNVTFLYPVDENEFISGGAQGFLYGVDQGISGNFHINYATTDTSKWVRQATGEVELRNNQFVKSQVSVDLNLNKLMGAGETAVNQKPIDGTDSEKTVYETTRQQRDEQELVSIPANSTVRCQATFVRHELEDEEVWGIDFIMTGLSLGGANSGPVFTGEAARTFFWMLAFAAGANYLFEGIELDDDRYKILGLGLLFLLLVGGLTTDVLPEVEQFALSQLGFRLIRVSPKDEEKDEQTIFEAIFGFRVRLKMQGHLLDALEWLADKLQLDKLFNAGAIFGSDAENIRLEGHAELEISNITISSAAVSPAISRLFERKDTSIKALKLPELKFDDEGGEKGTAVIPKVEFISHDREDGRHWYGLGFYLTALAGPSVYLDTPAAGLIVYFYPEPDIAFAHQLAKEPGFTFLIPKLFLAKGTFDLSKPIPAFEGTQSRVAVDVGILPTDPQAKPQELLKIANYKLRFNGEVAWGTAQANQGPDPDYEYDFYFVQVGYAGQTPLFTVGPVGLFGLDLLYGKNIAPGFPGNRPTAVGIANWILNSPNQADPYHNIRDWPASPSTSTWHPHIIWDSAANEYKSQRVAGFIVLAGSANDKMEAVKAEVLGLAGLDDFWMAVAAKVKVKPANIESIAIFAYDNGTYVFRLVFEFRINAQGKLVKGKVPLEIGSSKSPHRSWLYLGHYEDALGGPVILEFFKRYKAKFFLVYDSAGLENFGLMPIDAFSKPDIMGEAYGAGAMFQFGPYTFGPSFLNLKLFAALGANAAYGKKPHMLVGELYAGGYMQLKVIFFKFKLELLARLQGMAIEDAHRYLGEVIVKLNLPWPFDDVKEGFDFVIQSDNFVPLPEVEFEVNAAALGRIQAYDHKLFQPQTPAIPIDSVIALAFNKPLYEILNQGGGSINETTLLLNDSDPNNDNISEQLVTDYQDLKYIVNYTHAMHSLQVAHQPIGGGTAVPVNTMLASWEAPDLAADGTPVPGQSHHKVLYLNALFPPELQFNTEKLGAFNSWQSIEAQVGPCQRQSACLQDVQPRPELVVDGKPQLNFATILGDVLVKEDGYRAFNPYLPGNSGRLGWDDSHNPLLRLADNSYVTLPHSTAVRFGLNLFNEEMPGAFHHLVSMMRVQVEVDLRGVDELQRFDLQFIPTTNTDCGWHLQLGNVDVDPTLLAVNLAEVLCFSRQEVEGWIQLDTQDPIHLVQAIRIKGHDVLLDTVHFPEPNSPQWMMAMQQLGGYQLRLRNLCLERAQLGADEWEITDIGGGSTNNPPPPDQAVDTFIMNQLMEPDREYTVNYTMHTFAQLYHDSQLDGTELVNKVERTLSTTPDGAELRTVRFRTEATPSQDVSKYLGFVYPAPRGQRPYAASAVPLITFKYQGLIRKIYEKHGRNLEPTLLDMNGNEIETTLVSTIESHSGGFDAALEELLATCLPHVQTLPYLKMFSWARALTPDMRYSLQLTEATDPDASRIPFNVSFHTSRYADFAAHADAVLELLPTAGSHPVANSDTAVNDIAAFIAGVHNGTIPPADGAVERFYRDILSQDGGRLGSDPNQDYMSFLVGLDPANPGNELVWGVVLELVEPLIGRDSIFLNAKANIEAWQAKGITLTNENYLILRDASASRVIILNSADGQSFAPFTSDIALALSFMPEEPLRRAISEYAAVTFPDQSLAQQATTVAAALNNVRNSDPDIADALTGQTRILSLPLPP